jgi:hypothetical protein
MSKLKTLINKIANTAPGIMLRNSLGWRGKVYVEMPLNYSVSDLFFWCCDDNWRTRFDLSNLPSILSPQKNLEDVVTILFYNQKGEELIRKKIVIPPLQSHVVLVDQIVGENAGFGTMAFFHETDQSKESEEPFSCISEHGFVAYRRLSDETPLWSYVHGSAYVLAKPPEIDNPQTVRRSISQSVSYRPQVVMSDCSRFDLIYINPMAEKQQIVVRGLNKSGEEVEKIKRVIPERGAERFSFDNGNRDIWRIENDSSIFNWRPVIKKYYESHFDVFHG